MSQWLKKKSYALEHSPFISDVSSYHNDWIQWWTSCQPAWRREKGWPLPRDNGGTCDWVKVGARGQSGLFLIVLSTTWWAYSIQSEEEWEKFDEAVDDIEWVIGHITDSLKALQVSTQPAPSSNPPNPAPEVNWMARETGKRKPKPSRKLREGGGF